MDKDELAAEVMMLRMVLSAAVEIIADDPIRSARLTQIVRRETQKEIEKEERRKTLAERIYLRKLNQLESQLAQPAEFKPEPSDA